MPSNREGTGGPGGMGPVGNKPFCPPQPPRRALSRSFISLLRVSHSQRDLGPIWPGPNSQLLFSPWTEEVGVREEKGGGLCPTMTPLSSIREYQLFLLARLYNKCS
jgi:hypothetical protein